MSDQENATGPQVDQNREDEDGRISQAQSDVQPKDTKSVTSVTVPYITPLDGDIEEPEWFEKRVTSLGPDVDMKNFELDEIQGTRLVLMDGEWHDHGHVAIYRRKADDQGSDLASIDPNDTLSPSNPQDTNPNPPSSRPMTLRQQLEAKVLFMRNYNQVGNEGWNEALDDLVRLCQEIAREADQMYADIFAWLLGEAGDFPMSLPGHRYAWRSELRQRLAQQDTRSTVGDTENSEIASGQLTQKPPQEEE